MNFQCQQELSGFLLPMKNVKPADAELGSKKTAQIKEP